MHTPTPQPAGPNDMLCVVLSFNGYADTVACLDSLRAVPVPGFDLLVIDNASRDDVAARLAAAYPDVELIVSPENLGWAGGNNLGIRLGMERGYRWICLLNNDTVFPEGQVQAWLDAARAAPPGLLHPAIFYWDEPEIAQLHPDLDADRRAGYCPADGLPGLARMNFAYGACLAVHRDVFARIGVLDERFFLQLEETDFHLRAERAGFPALCNPAVRIFHKESRAFGGTRAAIKTYYSTRNTLLLIEKNVTGLSAKLGAFKRLYWSLVNLAASTERVRHVGKLAFLRWLFSRAPSARAVRSGVADYATRRFGKAPDSFREQLVSAERLYAEQLDARTS